VNIKYNYIYRDYSNYKNFNSVIFANPNNVPIQEVEKLIRENLIDGEFFNAQEVGLPLLFFDDKTEDDHQWHEFESLETTNETINIELKIEDIIERLKKLNQAPQNNQEA
jgi:hypothetical protein